MLWLSQDPTMVNARRLAVSTSLFGSEKPVDGFEDPKNGPRVHYIVPYNRKSSFWYKRWYARASRSEKAYSTTELLHVR